MFISLLEGCELLLSILLPVEIRFDIVKPMKPKVSLLARVNDGTGTFPFLSVDIKRRAIVLPVERKGQFFSLPDIIGFYARYTANGKRRNEPLGKDPVAAFTRFLQIEQDSARARAGLLPINTPPRKEPSRTSRNIAACAREFKAEIVSRGLKPRAVETYIDNIDNFLSSYQKESIDDIDRKDMIRFLDWMKVNLERRKHGSANNTYRNKLKDVTVFLKHFGVENPLPRKEWPKATKKNPDKYSIETVNQMLEAATEEEKDLIHFFLNTGFRDEEAAYSKYSDIDFHRGAINVHDKPEFKWSVKDHEQRAQDIVLQSRFIKRMKARRERHNASGADLVFPNSVGKPDMHLIRIPQRIAKRAGIEGRVTLHKFRRTFGTMVAKQYGLEQARIWLGHSDIATTQRYLAADEMTTEQSRTAADTMFAAVNDD
jgi:site-specific recombinase XerD